MLLHSPSSPAWSMSSATSAGDHVHRTMDCAFCTGITYQKAQSNQPSRLDANVLIYRNVTIDMFAAEEGLLHHHHRIHIQSAAMKKHLVLTGLGLALGFLALAWLRPKTPRPKPVKVTFDTNTLDKAARPERFSKDPNQPLFKKVHDALKAGSIQGVYSVTMLTVEGIMKVDRPKVMGGSRLERQPIQTDIIKNEDLPDEIRKLVGEEDVTSISMNLKVVQPDRQPLHPEVVKRVVAAKAFGFRVLKAPPRTGAFDIADPAAEYFVSDAERGDLTVWLDKIQNVAKAIEDRGVGYAQMKALGQRLAAGPTPGEIWFKALGSAANDADRNAVSRSFAEWADGDSIASHIAYGIDVFCTGDKSRSDAGSVFNAVNRQWLTTTYGVQFMSIEELAASL